MVNIPGMLMVGSAGRNVGKTEFACSLIGKFGSSCDIIGIKVTAIDKPGDNCPRGGTGCGVCSSLEGNFYITAETDSCSDKDTSRMLTAGAAKVFWLRTLKTHLEEAAEALLDTIGHNAVSICESNTLRNIVEPGLFVMLKACNQENCKDSAKDVARYADSIVSFDGNRFDIDFDDIELTNGKWTGKIKTTPTIAADKT